jgi:eukaryotic-like serine/threonine-protein kinase
MNPTRNVGHTPDADESGDRKTTPYVPGQGTRPFGQRFPSGPMAAVPSPIPEGAAKAMHAQDAARARGFAGIVALMCTLGLVLEPILRTDAWQRFAISASLVVLLAVSAWVWRITRDAARYTRSLALLFGAACVVACMVTEYVLGVFSPAPMLVTVGIAFFGLADDAVVALGVPMAATVVYAALSAMVLGGILPDAGILRVVDVAVEARVPMLFLVPGVFLVTLWLARMSRRAIALAVDRSNVALREIEIREAQLTEANRDMDDLIRAGTRQSGRYTGTTAGKFLIGELIGRGAMGEVYAASHTETFQEAAVKLLHSGVSQEGGGSLSAGEIADGNRVARFLREAEAASKLRAPNVVSIFEVGEAVDGAPYIAMELLRGNDLSWHLRKRRQLGIDEVCTLVEQVARGLEVARAAGVVHRDLKPQNLFLAAQPKGPPLWKILDFGVSRLTNSHGTLTQEAIVGTPGYMSPEQAAGKTVDHRSDIFSLAVVVYRAMTGQSAFSAPDTPQVLFQVVYANPVQPSRLVANLPVDVDLALAIALAKDAEDRFASATDFAAALRAASRRQLDIGLRMRGQTLVAALPWGSTLKGSVPGF